MAKFTVKPLWIVLVAIETVLLVYAFVTYNSEPKEGWNGIQFAAPIGFAFFVLVFTLAAFFIRLLNPKQPSLPKRGAPK